MDVNLDDFRRHFELLSDESLLGTNREELIESARSVYDAELERRGLGAQADAETAEAAAEATADAEAHEHDDEMVHIASYTLGEEANLARGLLESASIPSFLKNEYSGLGTFELQLMVPASFEEQAMEVLGAEISEDELAAQAEAAGVHEHESAEEPVED